MVSNYYYTPIILQPLLQKAPDFPSHCPNYKGSDCLNFLVHLVSINNCQKKLSKAGFPCCHWKDCFLYWTAPGCQCCSKLLFREYLHHHKESSVHHEESKKKKKAQLLSNMFWDWSFSYHIWFFFIFRISVTHREITGRMLHGVIC